MSKTHKRTNAHHLQWPRREYSSALEHKFRELPCLKVRLDVEVHSLLHRLYLPPRKPSVEQMEHLVHRHETKQCACFEGETTTRSIYSY